MAKAATTRHVYLAGPITGQSYEGATDWREYAYRDLKKAGITAFSPMRAKEYLKKEQTLSGAPDAYTGLGLSNPKGIVTRDRFDCMNADMILMNLLPAEESGVVSVGTMIELGWADAARVPVVLIMTEKNPMYHAMVTEMAGYIVRDLDSALTLVKAFLLPESDKVDLSPLHLVPRKQVGN